MRKIIRKSLRGVKGRKSHETEDQEVPSGVDWEEVFKRRAGGMLNRGRLGVKKEPLRVPFFLEIFNLALYHLIEQKFQDCFLQKIDKAP